MEDLSLENQLKMYLDEEQQWDNIFYDDDWTMEDVKVFFNWVSIGYLVQSKDNIGFIVNEIWDKKPPSYSYKMF